MPRPSRRDTSSRSSSANACTQRGDRPRGRSSGRGRFRILERRLPSAAAAPRCVNRIVHGVSRNGRDSAQLNSSEHHERVFLASVEFLKAVVELAGEPVRAGTDAGRHSSSNSRWETPRHCRTPHRCRRRRTHANTVVRTSATASRCKERVENPPTCLRCTWFKYSRSC